MEDQAMNVEVVATETVTEGQMVDLETLMDIAEADAETAAVAADEPAAAVVADEETKVENRGRKPFFEDRWNVIDTLVAIRENGHKTVSRHLKLQLVSLGFLEITEIKKPTRGRPAFDFQLTGMAKSRVALSKNWKRPVVADAVAPEVAKDEVETVTE